MLANMKSSTLLVGTTLDPASVNIANSLISRHLIWTEFSRHNNIWSAKGNHNHVYLWLQDSPLLHLNYADRLFADVAKLPSTQLNDVIFLSKHSASSGIASLTVHPIGIPWTTDVQRNGGLAGKCSPPSFRIASLYRAMSQRMTIDTSLAQKYQLTLEATHHGPYVEVPVCFVEIGSTQVDWYHLMCNLDPCVQCDEWPVKDAGEVWADVLIQHFGLLPTESEESNQNICFPKQVSSAINEMEFDEIEREKSQLVEFRAQITVKSSTVATVSEAQEISFKGVVMMLIGGGHYVPKMNDACKFGEGLFVGHCLTSYALQPYFDSAHTTVAGTSSKSAAVSSADLSGVTSVISSPSQKMKRNNEVHDEVGEGEGVCITETQSDTLVEGGWEKVIIEAVTSTRVTFPDCEVICLVDKKAFIARNRDAIVALLDRLGCRHTYKLADVKLLWDQTMKARI